MKKIRTFQLLLLCLSWQLSFSQVEVDNASGNTVISLDFTTFDAG